MPRLEGAVVPGGTGRVPNTVEAYLTATHLDSLEEDDAGLLPHERQALEAAAAAARSSTPPMLTGTQLYQQWRDLPPLLTGCEGIDEHLLLGGLRRGHLHELCGESATGKTQLCLAAAARTARDAMRVVYVDTSNAFSSRRLQRVLAALPPSDVPQVAADPLKFVDVRRCYDAHALLRTLDELLAAQAGGGGQGQQDGQQQGGEAVQQQQQQQAGVQDVQQPQDPGAQQGAGAAATAAAEGAAGGPRRRRLEDLPVALLIVDCLSALITPVLGGGAGQHSQGHALLAAAATSLKAVAAGPWKPVVLVTNHMVGGSDDRRHEKRPAMGESWRNQAHTRIQLSRPPGAGAAEPFTATIRSSSYQLPGVWAPYLIGEAGLVSPAAAAAAWQGGHPQPMQD